LRVKLMDCKIAAEVESIVKNDILKLV
jgi:hypothetical protein